MMKLIGTDGVRMYTHSLKAGKYIVGRRSECDIPIPHKTVSREHAEVEVSADGKQCYITDLGSHNGTFINGVTLNGRKEVKPDDIVMFGHTEFRLTLGESADTVPVSRTRTKLSDKDIEKSVFLSIDEALKPLPDRIIDLPELLPTVFEMAKMLSVNEPKETMLNRSLEMINRIIPAERLAILNVSKDRDEVVTLASHQTVVRNPGDFTLSRTIVNEIVSNKKSILIGNPMEDDRFAGQQSIIMSQMKSAIAVPLFDEGKVLGILYADTTNPAHHYTDEYLRVMAACGNIIASRLLNYELLAERQEREIMDAELKRAASIQKKLLVGSPPRFTGYDICAYQKQSRSVGGDLYDIKILPDGRLLYLVADVSGKGMGAALLMTNIVAAFRILYESEQFNLAEAVRLVSLQLFKYSAPGDFATLFAGLVDPRGGKISFLNAGHNPAMIIRLDGTVELLNASGLMIGAFDFGDWKEESVELSEGDLLFVYTDGVTEAERGEELYGEERLIKAINDAKNGTADEIVDRLMKEIIDFAGDTPQSDDITMLLIKKEGQNA
jgi:serine phosphatase RsbU (regulator of sigma subunit)